jgi:hypothetical protein
MFNAVSALTPQTKVFDFRLWAAQHVAEENHLRNLHRGVLEPNAVERVRLAQGPDQVGYDAKDGSWSGGEGAAAEQ